jgi:hypothetical protein
MDEMDELFIFFLLPTDSNTKEVLWNSNKIVLILCKTRQCISLKKKQKEDTQIRKICVQV